MLPNHLNLLFLLITTFAAIKISKGLFEFGKGFFGGFKQRWWCCWCCRERLWVAELQEEPVESDGVAETAATQQALTSAFEQ